MPVLDSDGRTILFAHHLFLLLLEFPEIIFPYIGPFMGGAVIDLHIFLNGRMLPDRVGQIFFTGQRIDLTNWTGTPEGIGDLQAEFPGVPDGLPALQLQTV